MSAAAVDDINRGMVAKCQEQEKALYYSEFPLSKDQPCGQYKIIASVTSSGGSDTLTNYIDVLCVFALQIDFNAVDWGLHHAWGDQTWSAVTSCGRARRTTSRPSRTWATTAWA